MPDRIKKINELIKHHVSEILTRELDLKSGLMITISKVSCTRDLKHANISISVFPESEYNYAMKTLGHEKGAIQKKLNKKLSMKFSPQISFLYDNTETHADEVEKILISLHKNKEL